MAHTTMATSGGFLLLLLQLHLAVMMGSLTTYSSSAAAGVRGTSNHTAVMPSAVPCLADQAAALLRLKRLFAASNASAATFRSWRPGTDCCHWQGVHCARGGGRVTSLDLGGRALQSDGLDPAVFDLTSLMYLNLAYNDFNTSELPSTGFEKLTELTHLNLSASNFSGVIPSSIGRLTSLISLDLSSGDIYYLDLPNGNYDIYFPEYWLVVQNFEALIANLKNLRELQLDVADLSSSRLGWCDIIAKYTPNLQVLSLPLCSLSGPICGSFSRLHSLVVLNLQNNHLAGPIPYFFANFSSLKILQISYNHFTGWFPSVILEQRNLVTVDLSHNKGISDILPDFSADSRLENIFVSLTNFSGAIPSSVGNLKYLKKLDLSASETAGFSGTIPSSIGRLKSLDLLALSGYGLEGTIPTWIANLTSLTVLKISNCGLSGSIPSFMRNFRKLKGLTLSNCKFSGNIPSFISNLTQLVILNLQSNNFVGTVELSSLLWKLPNLSMLSLSKNRLLVVDREHNSSAVYPMIYALDLASCSIDEFPKALRFLENIHELDLSCNQIQGEIPKWAWDNWSGSEFGFMNLSHNKFTSLGFDTFLPLSIDFFDLRFNMFQGPIPVLQSSASFLFYSNNMFTSIPFNISLDYTSVFMASSNNISGSIPTSFCSSYLEILDLSWNNLNGPVPSCLMDGTSTLRVLNLRRNQIRGELPRSINESCSLEFLNFSDNQIRGQLPRSLLGCKNLEVLP